MKFYLYLKPETKDYLQNKFDITNKDYQVNSPFVMNPKLHEAITQLINACKGQEVLEGNLYSVLIDIFQMRIVRVIETKRFKFGSLTLKFSEPRRHYCGSDILHSIVNVPALKNGRLDSENHEFGYHIHLGMSGKKYNRTDILLTFNKNDQLDKNNYQPLYWERHAEKGHVTYDIIGISSKKRSSIHQSCLLFLNRHPLRSFKIPSNKSYLYEY